MTRADHLGRLPLHYAAMENNAAEVERLVSEGNDVNLGDKQGFTPLHLAAQEYSLQAADELLKNGALVDSTNQFGNTPLFVAVFNSRGSGEMIKLLRRYGADARKMNNHGQTSVGLAQLIGNYNVHQFFSDLD